MSNLIVILGESGTGKSTSIRNLDPNSTYLFNVLSKPLPFRGYKSLFSDEKKNMFSSDDHLEIMSKLKLINEKIIRIKTVIIDDFTFLTNNEYMRRCRENGFGRFNDLGKNVFDIFTLSQSFRDDLHCYIMCHTEKDHSGSIVPQTIGKMTQNYVGVEKRATIVLHSMLIDGQYKFMTQNDGMRIAKSPMGMFDLYIDNDLKAIRTVIDDYYYSTDNEPQGEENE
jgi:hypothetical protein